MSTQTTPLQQFLSYIFSNKKRASYVMMACAVLLLGASAGVWWAKVYTSPHKVFWDVIDQNLATTSYTKTVKTQNDAQTVDQTIKLQFTDHLRSQSITSLKQPTSSVVSETIGTPKGGYARYTSIKTAPKSTDPNAKAPDFSSIEGVWSKLDTSGSNGSVTSMIDEAVFGPILFGNLSYSQRHKIISDLRAKKAYVVDYSKLKKTTKDGRKLYTYNLSVKPKSFIASVADYYNYIGLKGSQFEGGQYSDENKVVLEVTVDVLARRITTVKYQDGSGRTEAYPEFGKFTSIELPKKTIPTTVLQERLQKIEQ